MNYFIFHVGWDNNPVYETAKETLMYRTVLWQYFFKSKIKDNLFYNSSLWVYLKIKIQINRTTTTQ